MSHARGALRRTVPAGAAVLDLGCGPGRHTGYLTDRRPAVLEVATPRRAVTRAWGARVAWCDELGILAISPDRSANSAGTAGTVQLSDERCTSAAIPWARLIRRDLPAAADAASMTVLQEWTTDARAFALVRPVTS